MDRTELACGVLGKVKFERTAIKEALGIFI